MSPANLKMLRIIGKEQQLRQLLSELGKSLRDKRGYDRFNTTAIIIFIGFEVCFLSARLFTCILVHYVQGGIRSKVESFARPLPWEKVCDFVCRRPSKSYSVAENLCQNQYSTQAACVA